MIRYIVSMVCVALAVAFTGYAVTGFVPPVQSPSMLMSWQLGGIDTSGECARNHTNATTRQGSGFACDSSNSWVVAAADGFVTGFAAPNMLKTSATAGIDCDLQILVNDVATGTVININDTNKVAGDWQAQNFAITAGDEIEVQSVDGSGGTCNQTTDFWWAPELWGYYTP